MEVRFAEDKVKTAIRHSAVSNNRAHDNGGGLSVDSTRFGADPATISISYSTLDHNEAEQGGGLFNHKGIVVVDQSDLFSNTAQSMGGGLFIQSGTLTLTTSTVDGNSAGTPAAVLQLGRDRSHSPLAGAQITGLGGGLFGAAGTVFIDRSSLIENEARIGGGIQISGPVTLTVANSTVSTNWAAVRGGGLAQEESESQIRLVNVTLYANQSFGGAGTGGGLFPTTALAHRPQLLNSVVARNLGGDCALPVSFPPGIPNLSGDDSCGLLQSGDPKVGALQENGGATRTHLPAADSPLVDAGDVTVCASSEINLVDQRGFSRVNVNGNGNPADGNPCDLGAVEREETAATPMPTTTATPASTATMTASPETTPTAVVTPTPTGTGVPGVPQQTFLPFITD